MSLAELLSALSLVTDLGMVHPPEESIKACLLATRLARAMGVMNADLSDIYYTTLLRYLGCNGPAHEEAALFGGDDLGLRDAGARTDFLDPKDAMAFLFRRVGARAPAQRRLAIIGNALPRMRSMGVLIHENFCEAAAATATRIRLPSTISDSLLAIFERWDGRGDRKTAGEDIPIGARFAQVASLGIIFHRLEGTEFAVEIMAKRSGKSLDPSIAMAFCSDGAEIIARIEAEDAAAAILDEEPEPRKRVSARGLDDVARAFADLTDLKSPFFHGHSSGVAELAEAAAGTLGVSEGDRQTLRLAALFHDLGRMGIANGIWEKKGSLTAREWEQVRLHAYHSERILVRSKALASLAQTAGMHHERQDGSGYHRQAAGSAVSMLARILGAADAYQAMTQARPHRPPLEPGAAAKQLAAEAEEGRLDARAASAVLAAAGHVKQKRRRQWPGNLTEREVDVLALVARGLSTREVASRLSIAPKTADNHIQSIYSKIHVSTRAGAALFAMEHDLLSGG